MYSMKNSTERLHRWAIAAVVLIVIAMGIVFHGVRWEKKGFGARNAWYAVHLANGQVYFGHIGRIHGDVLMLTDTHTLNSEGAPSANGAATYTITPRGTKGMIETDHRLFINRSAVLYWEMLAPQSNLAKMLTTPGTSVKTGG